MLFVLSLERLSCKAFDAFEATSFEVTFFAIVPPFLCIKDFVNEMKGNP